MDGSRGTRAIARAHVSTGPAALAAEVAAVTMSLRCDPVLGKHLQSSGCLGIGHGKVHEKPRLLKTIPESHWNALPESAEPERSWVLSYFIHFYFGAGLFSWKFGTRKLSQGISPKLITWGPMLRLFSSVLQIYLVPKTVTKISKARKQELSPKPKSLPPGCNSSPDG